MPTLLAWPGQLPHALASLYGDVATTLGADVRPLASLGEVDQHRGDAEAHLLVVLTGDDDPSALAEVLHGDAPDCVVVVGDDYLGTDGSHPAAAARAGAAISLVRSVAVRRERSPRANAVCVPAAMLDRSSTQRGPLPHTTDSADVAASTAFLLGPTAGYVNGQVMFVDGGRHLFSSMSA